MAKRDAKSLFVRDLAIIGALSAGIQARHVGALFDIGPRSVKQILAAHEAAPTALPDRYRALLAELRDGARESWLAAGEPPSQRRIDAQNARKLAWREQESVRLAALRDAKLAARVKPEPESARPAPYTEEEPSLA